MSVARPHISLGTIAERRQRTLSSNRTSNLLLTVFACIWLVLCLVFLVLLIPPNNAEGVVLRCLVAVSPIVLMWTFFSAGQGKVTALTALLLIILVVNDLSLRNRAYSDTSLDAQTLAKTALWGMGLLVALLNWQALRQALREPAAALLVVLCLWFIVTSAYSPIRAYSFGSSVALLSVVLFSAVVRQSVPDRTILIGAIAAIGVLLWFSLFLYVVAPGAAMAKQDGGQVLRLAAPFGTPNSLGRAAAVVLLLCAIAIRTNAMRWRSSLIILMGFAGVGCLVLAQSRTSIAALIGSIGLLLLLQRPRRLLIAGIIVVASSLLLMLIDVNPTELLALLARSGKSADVVTLTGRTELWSFVWGEIEKAPLLGYGYSSTRYLIPLLYKTFWGWTAAHAHNMWLQTWFVSGVVGVCLLFAVLVAQFRYYLRTRDVASLGLLAFVFVTGLTEAGQLDSAPSILTTLWAVFLVGRRTESVASPTSTKPLPISARPSHNAHFSAKRQS
jgi:O-antigen ligase